MRQLNRKKGKRPILTYDERFLAVNSVRYVTKVIEQKTPSYEENLRSLRPEYVVHGNDWSDEAKKTVENTIAKWGGKLVETDYSSYPASSTVIKQRILNSLDK